jgi:hypothetical protein
MSSPSRYITFSVTAECTGRTGSACHCGNLPCQQLTNHRHVGVHFVRCILPVSIGTTRGRSCVCPSALLGDRRR